MMRGGRTKMCLNLDRKFPNLKIKRSLNPDKEFVISLFKRKHLKKFTMFLPFNHYSEPLYYQLHIRSSEGLLFCFSYYLQLVFDTEEELAFMSSAAIEIFSALKIILDDIFDNDEIRSGCPSIWKKYGLRRVFLTIDFVTRRVIEELSSYPKIERIIKNAWLKGLESFWLEEKLYRKKAVTIKDWLNLIPSFAPFGFAACSIIGNNSKISKFSINCLKLFNKYLTIAWVFDDPLDVFYLEKSKKIFSDIRNGYFTLPIVILLQKLNEKDKKIFEKNFGKGGKEFYIVELLKKYEIKEKCFQIVKSYHKKAMKYLKMFWEKEREKCEKEHALPSILRAYSYLRATKLRCDFL